ncbi:MAG: TlpA family protein disulfide reductase [Rikenellaceae bacterium]|nr:TlpA family protein disulfide reductase [Rikenellaceae bacterium]
MKKLFVLLCILASYLHAHANEEKLPKVIIGGIIENNTDEALVVQFSDRFSRENTNFSIIPDKKDGSFRIEYEQPIPRIISAVHGNTFFHLVIEPGDSLFISMNGNAEGEDFVRSLSFSGDRGEFNNQFTPAHYSIMNELQKSVTDLRNYDCTPEDYYDKVVSAINEWSNKIEEYSKRYGLNPEVTDILLKDMKFFVLTYGNYINKNTDYDAKHKDSVLMSLLESPLIDITDDKNLVSFNAFNLINTYAAAYRRMNSPDMSNIKDMSPVKRYMLPYKELPSGLYKDFILFSTLSYNTTPGNTIMYEKSPDWEEYLNTEFVKERMRKIGETAINGYGKPVIKECILMNPDGSSEQVSIENTDFITFLQQRNPGKVIYLDVFSSWCTPCIQEFAHAPALAEKTEGKDIAFVYLCLSSKEPNWINIVKEHNLHGDHIFMSGEDEKNFMENYRMYSFPNYFIIDKEGNVSRTTLRPSSGEMLVEELEKYL